MGWCLLDFLLACEVFLHFIKITFWDSSCLATLSYLLMKGQTHISTSRSTSIIIYPKYSSDSPTAESSLGLCNVHYIFSLSPPSPPITQHQICLVDFLHPMKELLWSSTSLKCPTVVAFAASIYTVNTPHCLLPLMLHSHFQMAQDSSVDSPKHELNQTKT